LEVNDNNAILSWTELGTATQWEVIVQPINSGLPDGTEPEIQIATSNPYTYEGLTPGVQYEFYVRSICDGGLLSDWRGPMDFQTPLCPAANQCMYTFILTDTFADGWNGNTMTVSQNGAPVQVLTLTSGGFASVQVPLCHGVPFTLFWNSGGNWAAEVGISIEDPNEEIIYTKAPGTGAPNKLLFTAPVNCTPPTCPRPNNLAVANVHNESVEL